MEGISFVEVVDAGPRYTTVLADDGETYTLRGDRNWRNNNPGNIEYGEFAKSMGAIGSDGRFAVFPSAELGQQAQETLQFEGKNYRDKSIIDAITTYAPEFENDSAAYAEEVAAAAGVPITTKMSELSPQQRKAFLDAQRRVEGLKPGTITSVDGEPVSREVARQFAMAPMLPASAGGKREIVGGYQRQLAARGFDPGPIDGVQGPRMTAAIKAFQEANGLEADGIVGPKTLARLQGQARPQTQRQPPPFNPLPAPRPLVTTQMRTAQGNLLSPVPLASDPSWDLSIDQPRRTIGNGLLSGDRESQQMRPWHPSGGSSVLGAPAASGSVTRTVRTIALDPVTGMPILDRGLRRASPQPMMPRMPLPQLRTGPLPGALGSTFAIRPGDRLSAMAQGSDLDAGRVLAMSPRPVDPDAVRAAEALALGMPVDSERSRYAPPPVVRVTRPVRPPQRPRESFDQVWAEAKGYY
jgi:hypothetical protein